MIDDASYRIFYRFERFDSAERTLFLLISRYFIYTICTKKYLTFLIVTKDAVDGMSVANFT